MVLMTMIARVSDGLPLAASVQDDQQVMTTFSLFVWIAGNLLKQLFITIGTDGKKCPRVPKPGEDVVPEIERSVAAADEYRERTIPLPVSDWCYVWFNCFY